jgi:sodium-coupled monocarboxylate transporter 8/12
MFLPLLIYVPSLAFNQVSGANIHLIGAVVCIVCVFYTILGGLKAVVYTDTWQTVVMFISVLVVVILGIISVGGMNVIIERAYAGNRLHSLNFSPNMYDRYTVFSVLIGGFTYWTSFNSVHQTMVQRYLSLPNDKQAKLSVGIFTVGVVFFISMCCFAGVLVFSTYYDCDPLTANRISNSDQLIPLFVVETAGHLRGVPGLFIAGVFGAALSSLSVVLNSTSVVLLEDVFKGVCHFDLTETRAKIISKCIVLILGVISVCLVFVVEHMGGVFEVASSLSAIVAGTMFGVFSLGMLIPWANTKGAVAGAIAGFIMSCIVSYGGQYASSAKLIVHPTLPISVDGCAETYGINVTAPPPIVYPDESAVFPLFRLSYLWITPIGVVTVLIVGVITSFLTGKTDIRFLDPELISPVCQWILPEEAYNHAGSAVKKIKHQRLFGGRSRVPASMDLN